MMVGLIARPGGAEPLALGPVGSLCFGRGAV